MSQQSLNSDHVIIRMEHMETLLLQNIKSLGQSIKALSPRDTASGSECSPAPGAGTASNLHTLNARISLLEESFANICNTLGRLDQEFQMMRQTLEQGGK